MWMDTIIEQSESVSGCGESSGSFVVFFGSTAVGSVTHIGQLSLREKCQID